MSTHSTPADGPSDAHDRTVPPPEETMVDQAGQIRIGDAVLVVHRTLADEHSAYVVLRGRDGGDVFDLAARPGQEIEVPGAGAVLVAGVRASTRERRGAVLLRPL